MIYAPGFGGPSSTWRSYSTGEGRHADAVRLAAASQSHRDRASAGPTPGFGGMLEGDPAAESGAHLTQAEARRAWEEGLT